MELGDEELDSLPFLLSTGGRKKEKQNYLRVIGLHLCAFLLYSLANFLCLKSYTSQGRSLLTEMSMWTPRQSTELNSELIIFQASIKKNPG